MLYIEILKYDIINTMKKLLYAILAVTFVFFPFCSKAANEAVFTITSPKTNYSVGDDIQISLNVDAGPYVSTLSVIDFDLKISDTSVVELKDSNQPFVPGNIFSTAGIQGVSGSVVNAVTYINPTNKPSSRSGTIGTINFKALKEGSVTFSYDRIEAAEESKEDDYVTTSASSLTVTIGSTTGTTSSSSLVAAGSSGASSRYVTPTPTVKAAKTSASNTSTGPEAVFVVAALGGIALFTLYKILEGKERRA